MGLPAPADGGTPGYYGVYPAIVTDLVDEDGLGRVEVRFPWLGTDGDRDVRAWATLCSPYADDSQGLLVLPEVGSQVVVAFEAGNLRRPYVVGSTWNGREALPHRPAAANDIRLFRSRADSRLEFDDAAGAQKVRITMASGHEVTLDDGAQEITVRHATGCTVRLTVTAVEIQANVSVDVTAPMVKVDAPIATFSGIVKVGTLIAEQMVMSPAYTPGAGNIW
ncbi:phage baseplate assembly protein V [Virgisporangium ochraceum]|uniref:Phage tail protein n=1 Tax=Virgisporangium ochraceum TaxID=65505 RepID=A0A8J4A3C8_9ACTN|nr:phage baseplate assembly protein V [Virgisporangium ochraceum]GIJ75092.1 phage tail protein [Virgisporangium ochraceum]